MTNDQLNPQPSREDYHPTIGISTALVFLLAMIIGGVKYWQTGQPNWALLALCVGGLCQSCNLVIEDDHSKKRLRWAAATLNIAAVVLMLLKQR